MSASLYITKERLVCIQITATQHKNWILLLRWYLFDCRKDWEGVIGVRPPTALRKHQPERGGIQRPGRSCHLRGYHNYPWGWAQTQVNTSLNSAVFHPVGLLHCRRRRLAGACSHIPVQLDYDCWPPPPTSQVVKI